MEPATASGSGGPGEPISGEVTLSVPAHGAFLSLVRTATAGIGARLDLTIDEIEDLRIAVDEAAAILLPGAVPGATLDVLFVLAPRTLTITLLTETGDAPPPDQTGFGWTVLAALAGSVEARHEEGRTSIVLTHRSEVGPT